MLRAARAAPATGVAHLERWASRMMILFPLAALIAVAFIYREDLRFRALAIYFSLWCAGLVLVLVFGLSPGVFVAIQCALAVTMLIHVRANPRL